MKNIPDVAVPSHADCGDEDEKEGSLFSVPSTANLYDEDASKEWQEHS